MTEALPIPTQRQTTDDLGLAVVRLIGKAENGRLAYAADALIGGDLDQARTRAGARLAHHLAAPLALWPPATGSCQVWVTETAHCVDPVTGVEAKVATCEYVTSLSALQHGDKPDQCQPEERNA